ncbi:MAG: hypothetical protein MRZ79_03920 [Bacteroidia bacterium]|nr:hypothetical protein [Bacteroidia bacterium]
MSSLEILKWINTCQVYVMISCCLLCFVGFERLKTEGKIIAYYLFFLLVINTVAILLARQKVNNLSTTHILVLGESIFLFIFYREVSEEGSIFRKYFKIFIALLVGLIITNTLFIEKINTFNTNAKIFLLFVIIFLSTNFFYNRSRQLLTVDAYERSLRIINTALLLYYSGSFFVYLFYKFTQNNLEYYSNYILVFNSVLYMLFTILMLVSFGLVIFRRRESEEKLMG